MSPNTIQTLLQPPWFFLTFAVAWLAMSGALAHVGGWASLAKRFRTDTAHRSDRFRFASGSFGHRFLPVSYGNCLFVTVNAEGVRLSILPLFRFQSPPLFIPWSQVSAVEAKRIFFFRYSVITIRDHWSQVSLHWGAGRAVKDAYDAATSRPRAARR